MDISANSYIPTSSATSEKKNLPGMDADAIIAAVQAKKNTRPLVQTVEEADAAAKARSDQTIADFQEYMSKSTMDKYIEAWLKKHGLTKEDVEKMSPEDQQKIMTKMKEDIEQEIKLSMERKQKPLNILV